MGFFKKLGKALNPVEHFKHPKQALKNFATSTFDPLGTTIRQGRGDQSLTMRSMVDPGGVDRLRQGAPQAAPTSYTPQHTMNLSPGAQQLYDSMKARTAARMAAQQQPQVAPQVAPQPVPGSQGLVQNVGRVVSGRMLADGGKVGEPEYDGDYFESKSFERKPNGKPY